MIKAAGILFVTPNGNALFLKRGPESDFAGHWDLPGGRLEAGETAEVAAVRETIEEVGELPKGKRVLHTRRIQRPALGPGGQINPGGPLDEVDYTTFVQRVSEPFLPTLNEEHTGSAWAPTSSPPAPLHPGAQIVLDRLNMDESGVARAIMAGELVSPQRYENVSLFAVRITGTGTAYRKRHEEFVYRAPENYLTQEFLDRCNGLAVVFDHPKKSVLDSKSFGKQIVGTIVLPYIQGDEVWGIAKIYDDETAQLMEDEQLSTSPAVFFRDPSVNSKVELEDGSKLLIEGKPSLLDHLAICERGVWDKGGAPSGVLAETREDSDMTEEEKAKAAADKAKADAEAEKLKMDAAAGETLDKCLKGIDSLSTRMDAYDEEKKGEKEKADKARKDAEEKEAEEARMKGDPKQIAADKKKADAEEEEKQQAKADSIVSTAVAKLGEHLTPLKEQIAAVAAMVPKALSDADHHAMADAQARADTVYSALGMRSAPRPVDGETVLNYRKRLAGGVQKHSKAWSEITDLKGFTDKAWDTVETQIFADAMNYSKSPDDLPADQLREVTKTDLTGRRITEFHGKPSAWMGGFKANQRRLVGIRNSTH